MTDREKQLLFLFRAGLLPLVGLAQLDGWKDTPGLCNIRADLISLLGNVEEAAGLPRTLPRREERRQQRDLLH